MNDWIEHDGGDRPVPGDTLVYVKFANGYKSNFTYEANYWDWDHDGSDYDIIAYRVVK